MSTEAPTLTELLQSDSRWLRGTLAACVENTTIKGFVPAIQEVAGRIDAILATQAQVPTAEPPGWKLVPIEPTDAMQQAGALAVRMDTTVLNKMWTGNAVYRAMLAAIPDSSVDPALIRGDTKGSSDHGASAPSGSGGSEPLGMKREIRSADTRDWHLAINLCWQMRRTWETIDCPRCHGRGEVGGGFKDLEGPRECPECFGSRIKTLPLDPPLEDVPSYPAGLKEHMRQSYRAFFANREDQPAPDVAEPARPDEKGNPS